MALVFRRAVAGDLPALSALCLRSKAVWGYDAAFLEACRDELTLRPGDLKASAVGLAVLAGVPLAVAQVGPADEEGAAELWKLFIAPEAIGQGLGRAMMVWARAAARACGARHLYIVSDPGAEGFYLRQGAVRSGETPSSSIPGRKLPRLRLTVI